MAARSKAKGKSQARTSPKGFVRKFWDGPGEIKRARSYSEYFMLNFSVADTKKYLEKWRRPDVDAEGLSVALHRAILAMDQMRDELTMAERSTAKAINNFQEDLSKISLHAKKLCEVLGVAEDGIIKTNANGAKARYSHTETLNQKPTRKDNLYWGLGIAALSSSKKFEGIKRLKTSYAVESLGYPYFTDRIKSIAQEVNLLRAIVENIRKQTTGGKSVIEDACYRAGFSFHITPEQWIIARILPDIYEDFFGEPLHISRDRVDKTPYGTGLEFLMWCLERIGITLSKETVCKYYYDHRLVAAS